MADNMSTEPRDIIAQAVLHYLRHELRSIDPRDEASQTADVALAALTAAGYVMFRPENITRIDIIGDRVTETWADECFASIQDDGHTLKLFPYGEGLQAQEARAKALMADLKSAIAERRSEAANAEEGQ